MSEETKDKLRERGGATESYKWSNFPATPGPESFRVLNPEAGR